MNIEQMKLLLPLLEQLSQSLSNNGCNDWYLPNTPTGQQLWRAINYWADPKDEGEWTLDDMSKPKLLMMDFTAIDYLIHCIENNLIQPE